MLYHPSIYDPAVPAPSWWLDSASGAGSHYPPLETHRHCEIAVIGGGYTGLSAALHLARDHHRDVCLLEAGQPGWGASGRNGGFCCLGGSMLGYQTMVRRFGLEQAKLFHRIQVDAVELVRSLGEVERIGFDTAGEGEYQLAHRPSRVQTLRDEQQFLREVLGFETQLYEGDDFKALGMGGSDFHAALHTPVGFGLHPLKYARGLALAAARAGAALHGESKVIARSKHACKHRLATAGGTVTADRLILATNAYTPEELFPEIARGLVPALSAILVTRPLTPEELERQGWLRKDLAYDTRTLLHYFRLLPDGRFLFGGRGGTAGDPAALARRRRALTKQFHALFPAWSGVDISHFWSGLVCISRDKVPHLSTHPADSTVAYALAYHGNGVAMATWQGRAVADLVARADGTSIPRSDFVKARLRAFPVPALRLSYLRAAYLGYLLRDAL